jgi:hypothetical protein
MRAWTKSGWIDQRHSIISVKLDPVLFKVETLLAAIRAMNWCQRDWQAQIADPGRNRLVTHLTLHTMMSRDKECFGTSKLIFRRSQDGPTSLSPVPWWSTGLLPP